MPLMDQDMLDLFGDDPVKDSPGLDKTKDEFDLDKLKSRSVGLVTESRALYLRLEQSFRSGCCQRLAWSRTGAIAYISDDQRRIFFRTTVRDPNTNNWVLTDDSPEPIKAAEGVYFTHIQWSRLGLDLLALDKSGQHFVYTLAYALDRLQPQATSSLETSKGFSPIVGLHWLPIHPQQFRVPQISQSVREGDEWVTKMGASAVDWPHHSVDGKTAFIVVTQSFLLHIVWQLDGQPWPDATVALNDPSSSDDILTHAAFVDANQFLYLTTYSSRGCLRLYRIVIEWTSSPPMNDPSRPPIQATLNVEGLHVVHYCQPQSTPGSYDSMLRQSLLRSRLSKLMILPPNLSAGSDPNSFQVLAIFVHAVDRTNNPFASDTCSSIVRWKITQRETELLDAFKNLKPSNVKLGSPESVIALERLDDWRTSKILLGVEPVISEPVLALTYSDGSVEFKDRDTLQPLAVTSDGNTADFPYLNGYDFPGSTANIFDMSPNADDLGRKQSSLEMALTSDACMAVTVNADDKLELSVMEYVYGWEGRSDINDYQTQQALTSIARQVALLTSLQVSADEPFALIPSNLPLEHRRYLMRQIYKILQRPIDFTLEDSRKFTARALRDALTAKLFSLQLVLGYRDTPGRFDVAAKLAFITLNLKSIATCLAQTVTTKDAIRADSIITLRYSVRWTIDLIIMILDDLFSIQHWRQDQNGPFSLDELNNYLDETNSASLLVLLCPTSRSLIRMMLELLKAYIGKLGQVAPQTGAQRALLQETITYSKQIPFKLPNLESLMLEIDNSIRAAFKTANLSATARTDAELTMLVHGRLPTCLSAAVDFVTGKAASKFLDSVDPTRITFTDLDWLGLRDGGDGGADPDHARNVRRRFDAIRKCPLAPGARLRTCRRCGSVMEDLSVGLSGKERSALPPWLAQAQRYCVCLGYWMVGS